MNEIEIMAGRVLVVGYPGEEFPSELAALAEWNALAGVILFKRNLGSDIEETARRIARIYSTFRTAPLVGVDQEGGRVARLGAPILTLPPMRALGELNDVGLTRQVGATLGTQLSRLGIGLDFAPVLDVDTNPDNPVIGDRSFGRTPEQVIRHARAFAEGLASAGVLGCGKHFPGHGDTDLDSHLALPRVKHDFTRLEAVELAPFRACTALPLIMTAHVVFDALESDVPATFSKLALEETLRGRFGYRGVIVSDDLEMGAVVHHGNVGSAAVRAIAAGCDMLLVCSSPSHVWEAHAALVAHARRDETFAARLREASARCDVLPRAAAPQWKAGELHAELLAIGAQTQQRLESALGSGERRERA